MLAALLANIRLPGGREFPWLKSQSKRDQLIRDDEEVLEFVTTLIASDLLDG